MEKGTRESEPNNLRLLDTDPAVETELRPEVRRLFDIIIRENPELSATQIQTFEPVDKYDAGGYYTLETEDDGEVTIGIHVSSGGTADYAPLMEIRKASVAINAKTIGIAANAMTPELLELFILAHEMGHVKDFVTNYQRDPDLDGWGAPDEMEFHRYAILKNLPVPNTSPTGLTGHMRDISSLDEVLKVEPRLANHPRFGEINSVEDLIRIQEEEYRAAEPERYADDFAAKFLNKHSEELGLSLHEPVATELPAAA